MHFDKIEITGEYSYTPRPKDILYCRPIYHGLFLWTHSRNQTRPAGKAFLYDLSYISIFYNRLALEIEKFHVYAKPNRAEAIARRQVIEQVRAEVRELFPHHTLEVFGSERTGLSLALSDIDLRLIRPGDTSDNTSQKPPEPEDRKRLLADLQALLVKKFKKNSANYAKPKLLHARYPLIATQDRQSGLDLQVVLSNDTSISRDTMRRYMKTFPYLRETYTLIRTIFDTRGLSDVFRGGFGSYSIFMMLVAALVHNPPKRPDPASALFRFLQFWSEFDPASKGISIEPPEFFDKKAHPVLPPKTQSEITVSQYAYPLLINH
jgi:non-canonical poly(A) RNA polymerase PAPD5/7